MGLVSYTRSSIGRKQLMAVTGLLLSLFTLTHMAGNLLIFVGADAYNAYGHALVSNPFIYVAEAGLVVLFFLHLFLAANLTLEARRARPVSYALNPKGARGGVSIAAKSMILTGLLLFVFVVLHLRTFKYGAHYSTTVDGKEIRDLYALMLEVFRDPIYVAWYIFSLLGLGLHLSHGVSSTFQTFGWNHPGLNPFLRRAGSIFAWLVMLGFSAVPVFVYWKG